jgi:hypothetical protein
MRRSWYKIVVNFIMLLGLATLLYSLSGCAHDHEQAAKMNRISHEYTSFVEECEYSGGFLWIDRPFTSRRVQNAPLTVWEKQDAVCTFSHNTSMRMRDWLTE